LKVLITQIIIKGEEIYSACQIALILDAHFIAISPSSSRRLYSTTSFTLTTYSL